MVDFCLQTTYTTCTLFMTRSCFMTSQYLSMVRSSRTKNQELFTSKNLLFALAVAAILGSLVYWWGIQSVLTPNKVVAGAFTLILVLAPPALVSFLIPWSPAGMLLQKINARTWGYIVVIFSSVILVYYSFTIQYQWWATQTVVRESDFVLPQVLVGLIGFIFIPALLWTPVSSDELVEQIRQAHLVRRYELQTQADIAILRNTLLKAQEKALIGFANLAVEEREELASVMRGLVRGIDQTMKELSQSVKTVSGVMAPFSSLEDNDDIQGYLDYISDSLVDTYTATQSKPLAYADQQANKKGSPANAGKPTTRPYD